MKKNRFFAGFLTSQEKWLNRMSNEGYKLTGTTIGGYDFDECEPGKYVYAVEYVGNKSYADSTAYKEFLEELGYTVYYKNINLDYSFCKLEIRPWADKGGKFATDSTTHNKEIMIIEKENDGKPFELHTTVADKIAVFYGYMKPYLFLALPCLIIGGCMLFWPAILLGVLLAIPAIINLMNILALKKKSSLEDQSMEGTIVKRSDVLVFTILLVASIAVGIALGSANVFNGSVNYSHGSKLGFVGSSTSHRFVAHYKSINGVFTQTLNVKDGTLDIEIETTGGVLNVLITDSQGNVLFDEKDVQDLTTSIPVEGKVRIELNAEKHSGSYSFE